MIQPDDNWYWYFDPEYDRVMLVLSSQVVFRSRFSSKLLANNPFPPTNFTVDDVRLFHLFNECCCSLPLNATLRAELVLNGIAAQRFLKPLLPKSWYFTPQRNTLSLQQGQIIAVNKLDNNENIFFMVVDVGESASSCVLAQPSCDLSGKRMMLGEFLKVMNDRFIRVVSNEHSEVNPFPLAM